MNTKAWLWSIVRDALLLKSEPAIDGAAEAIARHTPITKERAKQFLQAGVNLLLSLGDHFLGEVAAYIGAVMTVGAAAPDSMVEPTAIVPPDQLAKYRDVLDAIRDCDCGADDCVHD